MKAMLTKLLKQIDMDYEVLVYHLFHTNSLHTAMKLLLATELATLVYSTIQNTFGSLYSTKFGLCMHVLYNA